MLRQRCGQLLARLEHGLQLLELGGSVEEDYIRIARCFEATRQRCCRLEQDGHRAREQLARVEAERAALEVKLKHARNQVEVEMKKRHRAEAELEKQVRRLAIGVPCGAGCGHLSTEQGAVLCSQRLGWPAPCGSLGTRQEVRLRRGLRGVVGPASRYCCHRGGRGSVGGCLSPLWRYWALWTCQMPLSHTETPREMGSLPTSQLTDGVVSLSGLPPLPPPSAELTTVCGTNEDLGCHSVEQESRTEGSSVGQPAPAPFPSPPQSIPPIQHKFTSKTVIRPEPCGVCGSRIRFGKTAIKCCQCQLLLHTKCREQCPSLCAPRPHHHAWPHEGVLADFAPPTPPLVPALVVQCVTEVETRGLTETGLYRVPGSEQLVREWKRKLLRAGGALPALSSVTDIHVVCGVLKDFLRGLKEPLVTFSLHPAFLRAADIPDEAARSMDVFNLSRVFGPTLVGHSSANPTPVAIMEDTPRQCKVVARLLSLPHSFWRGFVATEQENLLRGCGHPAPVSAVGRGWGPRGPPFVPLIHLSPRRQGPAPRKVGRFFPSPV
uniref:Rac GTPase-activating protein 1 n=1 Tax=Malurus cyaneus samueli TaxID=2593467 RepID=A0A8C5U755_9PASS